VIAEIRSLHGSTALDGLLFRGSIMILLGLALLVATDLAGQRAAADRPVSKWWLVPFVLGQLLTMVPVLKLVITLLPRFPYTTIAAFDLVVSLVHSVLGIVLGLAAVSLLQQLAINLGRKLTGFPLNRIDWPYAGAIRDWLRDLGRN
jgi:hypothetical protein